MGSGKSRLVGGVGRSFENDRAEYLQRMEELGYHNISEDREVAARAIQDFGYSSLPKIVSPEEMDRLILEDGAIELYRGQIGFSLKKLMTSINNFIHGDFHMWGGARWDGIGYYLTPSYLEARGYASGQIGYARSIKNGVGGVLRMSLSKDAKIFDPTAPEFKDIKEFRRDIDPSDGHTKLVDKGGYLAYALLNGYDAVKIPKSINEASSKKVDHYVIFNRGKVVVSEEPMTRSQYRELYNKQKERLKDKSPMSLVRWLRGNR